MSGDDALPATIPKRARTAVKRPDPIETKNRMKGKMNSINKKSTRQESQRAATEKEQEVAEALFDLANLAGAEIENSAEDLQHLNSDSNKKRGKSRQDDSDTRKGAKSRQKGEANGTKRSGSVRSDSDRQADKRGEVAKGKQGRGRNPPASMPQNMWSSGMPHPAFNQNLYSQMMAWQQANFQQSVMPNGTPSGPHHAQRMVVPPAKSLKRCANHVYIAHLINYHQKLQQANLMQTMGMNFGAGKPPFNASGAFPAELFKQQQGQMQNQVKVPAGDAKQNKVKANAQPAVNNMPGQPPAIPSERDLNALKAQLMLPNPALLSLLYPGMQQQQVPSSGNGDAMGMGARQGGANQQNLNVPRQMQQYANQLQNSMALLQQQNNFPVMVPPGQFPVPPLGPNAAGMSPQQMAAFYAAAAPALAFAGGLPPNFVDPSAAGNLMPFSALAQQRTSGPMPTGQENPMPAVSLPDQNALSNNPLAQFPNAQALLSAGIQNIAPQLLGAQGDPQAAAAAAAQFLNQPSKLGNIAALSMLPGLDMKNAAQLNFNAGLLGANALGTEMSLPMLHGLKAQEQQQLGQNVEGRNPNVLMGQVSPVIQNKKAEAT